MYRIFATNLVGVSEDVRLRFAPMIKMLLLPPSLLLELLIISFILILLIIFLLYIYTWKKKYNYWKSRGIPGPSPTFPFGNCWNKIILNDNDPFEHELRLLARYGQYYGLYAGTLPTLIVADPDLVKQILVKDFGNFANRRILNSWHPVWNRNLFSSEYREWRRYRALTSAALSAAKLRAMTPLVCDCIETLRRQLSNLISSNMCFESDDDDEDVNQRKGIFVPKEMFTNFSIDITAATYFATKTTTDKSTSNEIVAQCLALADIPSWRSAAVAALPSLALTALRIESVFRREPLEYVVRFLRIIVAQQKALPAERRNDFIRNLLREEEEKEDMMMIKEDEAKGQKSSATHPNHDPYSNRQRMESKKSTPLSDDEIIAQCLIFFIASYEQIASLMTYCVYELALNADIQERLYAEIRETEVEEEEASDDKKEEEEEKKPEIERIERILAMPYLEAIIKESLRKYPPELRIERRVTGDRVRLNDTITLERDTVIEVPTIALHHNDKYFPDPARFDPERFMPENRHQISAYTFLPFGAGPRNCMGTRIAYLVAKLCLAKLVADFRFELAPDTPTKLRFANGNLSLLIPEFSLAIKRR